MILFKFSRAVLETYRHETFFKMKYEYMQLLGNGALNIIEDRQNLGTEVSHVPKETSYPVYFRCQHFTMIIEYKISLATDFILDSKILVRFN